MVNNVHKSNQNNHGTFYMYVEKEITLRGTSRTISSEGVVSFDGWNVRCSVDLRRRHAHFFASSLTLRC